MRTEEFAFRHRFPCLEVEFFEREIERVFVHVRYLTLDLDMSELRERLSLSGILFFM